MDHKKKKKDNVKGVKDKIIDQKANKIMQISVNLYARSYDTSYMFSFN